MSDPDRPIHSEMAEDARLRPLVEMFVAELPEIAGDISRAFAHDLPSELASAAHRLKGAAGMHGFAVISEAASELERSARAARCVQQLQPLIDRVTDLCLRATASPRGRQ